MADELEWCKELPHMLVPQGRFLIRESVRADRLFVLREGSFEVLRQGVRVARIAQPGALIGEISLLLGVPPTAGVIATTDSSVHVLEDATQALQDHPEMAVRIARLMARRLASVTAYLVDLKRQYAEAPAHLGVVDRVLSDLS